MSNLSRVLFVAVAALIALLVYMVWSGGSLGPEAAAPRVETAQTIERAGVSGAPAREVSTIDPDAGRPEAPSAGPVFAWIDELLARDLNLDRDERQVVDTLVARGREQVLSEYSVRAEVSAASPSLRVAKVLLPPERVAALRSEFEAAMNSRLGLVRAEELRSNPSYDRLTAFAFHFGRDATVFEFEAHGDTFGDSTTITVRKTSDESKPTAHGVLHSPQISGSYSKSSLLQEFGPFARVVLEFRKA